MSARAMTREEMKRVQDAMTATADLVRMIDSALVERYIREARPQADGTLDAAMVKEMSQQDMRKGQLQLRFLIGIGERVVEMQAFIHEQASEHKALSARETQKEAWHHE